MSQQADQNSAARARLLTAYRTCFTGDAGELVLAHLSASVGYGRPSFIRPQGGAPFDPIAAAIRDGRKSVLDEIHEHLRTPEEEPKALNSKH